MKFSRLVIRDEDTAAKFLRKPDSLLSCYSFYHGFKCKRDSVPREVGFSNVPHTKKANVRNADHDFQNDTPCDKKLVQVCRKLCFLFENFVLKPLNLSAFEEN